MIIDIFRLKYVGNLFELMIIVYPLMYYNL